MSTHNIFAEAILMSTHNICFYGELTKIILQLSSNTLICSIALHNHLVGPVLLFVSMLEPLLFAFVSHVTRKPVFEVLRPGKTEAGLLSHRD